MRIIKTEIQGLKLIEPYIHEDYRGTNFEAFNVNEYTNAGMYPMPDFVVDSISTSRKHVLRGIHGDDRTTKLVSCLYGTIYMIVIDRRPNSQTYNNWLSFNLSDRNKHQLLIPPGCGNGHLVMSDECVFSYKLDKYYDRKSQFTIKWNDPIHDFFWPIKNPILSERDR
jgi:dTDP-4-dehydrorhamnose 3,5-epimerase